MNVSQQGVEFIAQFEGFSASVYPDPGSGNVPYTQGFGTTVRPNGTLLGMGDPIITKEIAYEWLGDHINKNISPYLNKTFSSLSQEKFDSLVSLIYNIGLGNFDKSSVKRDILANVDCDQIASHINLWNKASGKILNGLILRRKKEGILFCTGQYK